MHPSQSSDYCRAATAVAPVAQPFPWLPLAYLAVSLLLGSGAMHFAGPQLRQHAAAHAMLQPAKVTRSPLHLLAALPRASRARV